MALSHSFETIGENQIVFKVFQNLFLKLDNAKLWSFQMDKVTEAAKMSSYFSFFPRLQFLQVTHLFT